MTIRSLSVGRDCQSVGPRWRAHEKGRHPWSFFLHSLVGLKLSLFFGFVCLTGTIATLSHEIEWLLLPKVRATVAAPPASWGSMWEAARTAHPQGVFQYIARPSSGYEDYLARVVSGTGPDGRTITLADRHVLLIGAGHTRYREELDDYEVSKTNPRLGYIYKLTPTASVYASYATGFFPSTSVDRAGEFLAPEKMRQVELGFKADLLGERMLLSGAVFDIRQRDQAVTDPASLSLPPDERYSINLGETRTRGVELQAIGKLNANWRLIAGYAYLDAELVEDGPDLDNEGNRLGGIPRHGVNLWTVYEFDGALQGLGLGGGVFAQSRVPIGFENRTYYGAWAQLDLAAYYKRGKWKAQLNIKNATDRDYLLTQALAFESLAAVRVGVATPRTVLLSVAREF